MGRPAGSKNKKSLVNPKLSKAIEKLLDEVMEEGSKATLTDKCKVVDRALKLEAIKAKLDDPGFGTGFSSDGDGGEE